MSPSAKDPTDYSREEMLEAWKGARPARLAPSRDRQLRREGVGNAEKEEALAVVFFLPLSDPILVPDATTFTFFGDEDVPELRDHEFRLLEGSEPWPVETIGKSFVSLRFWQVTAKNPDLDFMYEGLDEVYRRALPVSVWPDAAFKGRFRKMLSGLWEIIRQAIGRFDAVETSVKTIVEAVTVLSTSSRDLQGDEEELSDAFDACMEGVSKISRIYRLSTNTLSPPASQERLPIGVPFVTRTLTSPVEWRQGPDLMLLHFNVSVTSSEVVLDEAGMQRLFFFFQSFHRGHPLMSHRERVAEAKRSLIKEGDYANAIIHAQTSLEALFDGLLMLILWEDNMPPMDAATKVFSNTLHKRVRSEFPPRLGGDWNTKGSGPIGLWASQLVPLRNRVVHAAYGPSKAEAQMALHTAGAAADFALTRLAHSSPTYKRTAILVLGKDQIADMGAWSHEMEDFFSVANEEPAWLELFNDWRDQLTLIRETD